MGPSCANDNEKKTQNQEERGNCVQRHWDSCKLQVLTNPVTFAFAVLKIARASWGKPKTRFTLV